MRSRDDRVGGGRSGTERERYNGKNGGRVFKWYSRGVFQNYLRRMGVGEENCSERQCMVALAATSDELKKYPMEIRKLTPYLGPQCFPHLDVRSVDCRLRANEKPKRGTEDDDEELAREGMAEEGGGGVCAVMEEKCWLRCMECQKWRCVEPACAEVLRGTSYFGVRATDLDWASWLGEAQQRYAAAVSSHESA